MTDDIDLSVSRHTGVDYDAWRATMTYPDGSVVVSPSAPSYDDAKKELEVMANRYPPIHDAHESAQSTDEINPSHYKFRGIETIDWMEAQAPDQSYFSYHCRMQAQKYLARAGRKQGADATTDMNKCIWWINRYLDSLGKEASK